jgi:uncharacterized membrane protein YcaP (DUF421 family)
MNKLLFLWGEGENLTALQMSVRAAVLFIITLVLIRAGGVRIFGRRSSYDVIIMITMGAILARCIVGASPFLPTVCAAIVMIAIHRFLGWLVLKSPVMESLIKGKPDLIYKDGEIMYENLKRASLTTTDLFESLHLETKQDSLEKVEKAFIETNGRISFIMKEENGDG